MASAKTPRQREQARALGRTHLGQMKSGLEPTIHPSLLDIAWAAGVYEGEGNCQRNKGGSISLTVLQKEKWLCGKLRNLFGGSVLFMPRVTQKNAAWRWMLCGPRARGFLYTIFTWLSPQRRQQIRRALAVKGEK